MARVALCFAALGLASLGLSATIDDETAAIRFVHLSADSPRIDVLVSGGLVFRDVSLFGRTDLVTLAAGQHEIRVYPHRPRRRQSGNGDAGRVMPLEPVVTIIDLAPGTITTLVLTGAYEPPVEEEARGALSLRVSPADAEVTLEGPRGYRGLFQGDQFLVDLEPGPYRAGVRRPGYVPAEYETEVAAASTSLLSVTLQEADAAGAVAAAAEAPLLRSERQATWRGLEIQPYADETVRLAPAGGVLLRFVHTAPTVPDLDVLVRARALDDDEAGADAAPAADADTADAHDEGAAFEARNLGFPNRSVLQQVPAGLYDIEFLVAGTLSRVHEVQAVELLPGTTYTIYVTADPVTNRIWLMPSVDAVVPQHPPVVPEGRQ